MLAEYQFAKVLVRREQYGGLSACQVEHSIVGNPWLHFSDIVNQVPIMPKLLNDLAIYALVG
jgi:hypothetical protein